MTNQEIFDRVLLHLRKQGYASTDGDDDCLYRSPDGAMCAIGCLIPDSLYSKDIEGRMVNNLPRQVLIDAGINPEDERQMRLCERLQVAHDNELALYGAAVWEAQMQGISRLFGLTYTPHQPRRNRLEDQNQHT